MNIELLVEKALKRDLSDYSALNDAFEAIRLLEADNHELAHKHIQTIRQAAGRYASERNDANMFDLYKKAMLFDATDNLDAAFLYAEWNRDPRKRFYSPRRKQLFRIVKAMERLAKRKIKLLGVMAPPGVGKTTIALGCLTWMGLRNPEKSILGASHSNSFLRGVYDEIGRMLDPSGEYLWHEIFPAVRVVNTNAKDMRLDLDTRKRFETFEFSSVGSGNAGKVRASNLLYADDLVDGIESAMSKDRMDKLWQQYHTDLRQRMIGDCVELLIQTPWSLHDPIDKLEAIHENDPTAEFIHMPALDENDESNFDYPYGLGFTTSFYHQQRDIMDDASWRAIYMTQPIEREGQLYNADELRRYFELPDTEPDAIVSICDTKDRGADYAFMPIAYKYGNDYYIDEMICDNSTPDIVETRLIMALTKHNVHLSRFESNAAGRQVAEKIQKAVKSAGGRTKITTKYSTANKETRIIVASPWIKEHCLFKDDSVTMHDKEYRRAMNFLCSYTMAGKNKHDDVPDGMAMLADFVQSLEGNTVSVVKRIF